MYINNVYFHYYRECAIKFNDYFEFPRELDMEPYTVQGLAKIEGKIQKLDNCIYTSLIHMYNMT